MELTWDLLVNCNTITHSNVTVPLSYTITKITKLIKYNILQQKYTPLFLLCIIGASGRPTLHLIPYFAWKIKIK